MLKDKVRKFYRKEGKKEWERLEKDPYHKLEFKTTLHFLEKHLPKKGLILDAGGGPGRYTIELTKKGYEVVLLDLSPELLEIAKEKIKERRVKKQVKEVIEGSIDDLNMFKDEEFDAVVCLGNVLGHVVEEKDRKKAIKEMKRVTKSGSPLFISVTGRLAVIERALADYPEELTEPHFKKYRDTGRYEGTHGSTASHFYMLEELVEELKEEGLNVVEKIDSKVWPQVIERKPMSFTKRIKKDGKCGGTLT